MTDDRRWMRRALRLAARGFTTPNPMVGCVLVRDGALVGEGYHRIAGEAHAEIVALRAAGEDARGSTAYVTLEPCSHHGRTPPCVEALIKAGVARVVAAVEDPDERVRGRGFAALRSAGIEVITGVLEREARALNEAFFHHRLTGRPFVTIKTAMSLDGKIATTSGDSRWISGEASRRYVHRLRARSGAVLCGIGTVVADDPLLTARFPGAARQPLRVIVDSHLRIPAESNLIRTVREAPVLIAATDESDVAKRRFMEEQGVEILAFSSDKSHRVPLTALIDELGRRGIDSVLVEGGSEINASIMAERLAQKLIWFIAPKVIGGAGAPGPVGGSGAGNMSDALLLMSMTARRIGEDLLAQAYLDAGATEIE